MDNTLARKLHFWFTKKDLHYFRVVRRLKGEPIATFRLNPRKRGGIPVHGMHFREGMQIRNFLRGQKECADWNDHDFDDRYIDILKAAIDYRPTFFERLFKKRKLIT